MSTTIENWYALAVTAGQEKAIARRIRERLEKAGQFTIDMALICPDEEIVVDAGTADRKIVRKNTLPGYLLLRCRRLMPATASNIMRVGGVMDFLGGAEKPTPLSKSEIERIMKVQGMTGNQRSSDKFGFREGQEVTVTNGPLANFIGYISSINISNQSAQVEVEIFGRKTPAQVSLKDLKLVSKN